MIRRSANTIPLGRILGIPVGLDYSWFLIFALVTWTLASGYYPQEYPGWPTLQYWVVGALTSLLLFASVLVHELGHSVVAQRFHIPVRRITLLIFGGVAELSEEPPSAASEFWIAIAGPLASAALAGLFFVGRLVLPVAEPVRALLQYLAYINAILLVFNLIPGFPLDGGRVLRAVIWAVTGSMRRATLVAAGIGRLIAFGFIGVGVWQALSGRLINGLWIAFIGWFLENAASAQIQQQNARGILSEYRVGQAMSRDYLTVPASTTLQQIVDDFVLSRGRRSFVVEQAGSAAGLLTVHHFKVIPRDRWAQTTAREAMTSMSDLRQVRPDTDLWAALREMDRKGVNQLPVVEDGRVVGMLSREDVIEFLRTLRDLGE